MTIFNCTEATAHTDDRNITQSQRLNDPSITSHIGLNRHQVDFEFEILGFV